LQVVPGGYVDDAGQESSQVRSAQSARSGQWAPSEAERRSQESATVVEHGAKLRGRRRYVNVSDRELTTRPQCAMVAARLKGAVPQWLTRSAWTVRCGRHARPRSGS